MTDAKWKESIEWRRAISLFYYTDWPLVLPQPEFELFSKVFPERCRAYREAYRYRPMVPGGEISTLYYIWSNLAPEQKEPIKSKDELGDIDWFLEQLAWYPLIPPDAKEAWIKRYSLLRTEYWARYIAKNDTSLYEPCSDDDLLKVMDEIRANPRVAYMYNNAIQWTVDNLEDIKTYVKGTALNVTTTDDHVLIEVDDATYSVSPGEWIWPDGSGIRVGDYAKALKCRLDTNEPGFWIKPGTAKSAIAPV